MGRGLGKFAAVAAAAVAAAGWFEFLLKPVVFWQKSTTADVLPELLKFRNEIYDVPGESYLFLISLPFVVLTGVLLLVGAIRALIRYLDISEVGISVIHTRMHFQIDGPNLEDALVTREQLFHANQRNTSAYHLQYGPSSPTGVLVMPPIQFESTLRGHLITQDTITDIESRQHRVIETFNQDLPVSWIATYLPDNWVQFFYDNRIFFHGVVVKRRVQLRYRNEFAPQGSKIQITAPLYPGSSIKLDVDFPEHQAPPRAQLQCFRIMNNRVEAVPISTAIANGRTTYTVEVRNLFKETLRLSW